MQPFYLILVILTFFGCTSQNKERQNIGHFYLHDMSEWMVTPKDDFKIIAHSKQNSFTLICKNDSLYCDAEYSDDIIVKLEIFNASEKLNYAIIEIPQKLRFSQLTAFADYSIDFGLPNEFGGKTEEIPTGFTYLVCFSQGPFSDKISDGFTFEGAGR